MEQVRFVMASARIPTSRIRMPDGIEHFVEVVAALLNATFCFRKGKGVDAGKCIRGVVCLAFAVQNYLM